MSLIETWFLTREGALWHYKYRSQGMKRRKEGLEKKHKKNPEKDITRNPIKKIQKKTFAKKRWRGRILD
jgi:hypothetical protein